MKELTNLEICKRIAEIESKTYKIDFDAYVITEDSDWQEYNPLDDKELCFDLMIKYRVKLWQSFNGEWVADCVYRYDSTDEPGYNLPLSEKDPQRAICLAIIETHKYDIN